MNERRVRFLRRRGVKVLDRDEVRLECEECKRHWSPQQRSGQVRMSPRWWVCPDLCNLWLAYQDRVERDLGRGWVRYSVDSPPTQVAFHGRVQVRASRNEFFGGPGAEDYRSEVISGPTWIDLCRVAEQQIAKTCDHHHVYLEGFWVGKEVHEDPGVKVLVLQLGS